MSLSPLPQPSPENLYRDPYLSVDLEEGGSILRLTRSSEPFPNVDALEQSYRAIIPIYDRLGRRGRSLLADLRTAVGRNDPEYESAMRRILPVIDRGFTRVAVLVQTAVGALQVRRWSYEDDFQRLVSSSEDELLHYLRTGQTPPEKR